MANSHDTFLGNRLGRRLPASVVFLTGHGSFAKRLHLSSTSGLIAPENLGRLRSPSIKPIRQCVVVINGVKRIAIGGEQRFSGATTKCSLLDLAEFNED
jgi:hypothetical protein